jgi:hypothetical protein
VIVEGAIGHAAVCDMRCHGKILRLPAARDGPQPVFTVGQPGPIKKTQLCIVIPE